MNFDGIGVRMRKVTPLIALAGLAVAVLPAGRVLAQGNGEQADGDDRRDDREARQQPAGDGPRPERGEEEPGSFTEPVGLLGGQGGVSHALLPNSNSRCSGDGSGVGTSLVPTPATGATRWCCWC